MVTFSTSTALDFIDMADPLLVDFHRFGEGQGSGMEPNSFSWFTDTETVNQAPGEVRIRGSGFAYSSFSQELTRGTIISIEIDRGRNNLDASDIVITGTEGLVGSNINKDDPASFWNEVLKGNDTFDLSGLSRGQIGGANNLIFGDDLSARAVLGATTTTDAGGNDVITSSFNFFNLIGDAYRVAGFLDGFSIFRAVYDAGDDTIGNGASGMGNLWGDAYTVGQYGILNGGNDILDNGQSNTSAGESITGGKVNGGNDIITLNRSGNPDGAGASLPSNAAR
jgi:hypothetical protein